MAAETWIDVDGLRMPERFMAKVAIAAEPHERLGTPCWDWTGGTANGRGRFSWNGRLVYPYRLALAIRHRLELEELDGLVGAHACDNPACVNPAHVEPKTQQENMLDCVDRGRIGGFVAEKLARRAIAIRISKEKADARYNRERFKTAMAAD